MVQTDYTVDAIPTDFWEPLPEETKPKKSYFHERFNYDLLFYHDYYYLLCCPPIGTVPYTTSGFAPEAGPVNDIDKRIAELEKELEELKKLKALESAEAAEVEIEEKEFEVPFTAFIPIRKLGLMKAVPAPLETQITPDLSGFESESVNRIKLNGDKIKNAFRKLLAS